MQFVSLKPISIPRLLLVCVFLMCSTVSGQSDPISDITILDWENAFEKYDVQIGMRLYQDETAFVLVDKSVSLDVHVFRPTWRRFRSLGIDKASTFEATDSGAGLMPRTINTHDTRVHIALLGTGLSSEVFKRNSEVSPHIWASAKGIATLGKFISSLSDENLVFFDPRSEEVAQFSTGDLQLILINVSRTDGNSVLRAELLAANIDPDIEYIYLVWNTKAKEVLPSFILKSDETYLPLGENAPSKSELAASMSAVRVDTDTHSSSSNTTDSNTANNNATDSNTTDNTATDNTATDNTATKLLPNLSITQTNPRPDFSRPMRQIDPELTHVLRPEIDKNLQVKIEDDKWVRLQDIGDILDHYITEVRLPDIPFKNLLEIKEWDQVGKNLRLDIELKRHKVKFIVYAESSENKTAELVTGRVLFNSDSELGSDFILGLKLLVGNSFSIPLEKDGDDIASHIVAHPSIKYELILAPREQKYFQRANFYEAQHLPINHERILEWKDRPAHPLYLVQKDESFTVEFEDVGKWQSHASDYPKGIRFVNPDNEFENEKIHANGLTFSVPAGAFPLKPVLLDSDEGIWEIDGIHDIAADRKLSNLLIPAPGDYKVYLDRSSRKQEIDIRFDVGSILNPAEFVYEINIPQANQSIKDSIKLFEERPYSRPVKFSWPARATQMDSFQVVLHIPPGQRVTKYPGNSDAINRPGFLQTTLFPGENPRDLDFEVRISPRTAVIFYDMTTGPVERKKVYNYIEKLQLDPDIHSVFLYLSNGHSNVSNFDRGSLKETLDEMYLIDITTGYTIAELEDFYDAFKKSELYDANLLPKVYFMLSEHTVGNLRRFDMAFFVESLKNLGMDFESIQVLVQDLSEVDMDALRENFANVNSM